jgi:helix-turn-helix protein
MTGASTAESVTPGRAEKLLTVEEVAEWLRVTPAWIRAHSNGNRKPKLPSLKMGAFHRFRHEDIQTFLEELSKSTR